MINPLLTDFTPLIANSPIDGPGALILSNSSLALPLSNAGVSSVGFLILGNDSTMVGLNIKLYPKYVIPITDNIPPIHNQLLKSLYHGVVSTLIFIPGNQSLLIDDILFKGFTLS